MAKSNGFVSWLNWTAKIFWYTSFLTFLIVNISYVINIPALASNKMFVMALSLIVFWVLSFICTKDLWPSARYLRTRCTGSDDPAIILIVMGFKWPYLCFRSSLELTYSVATMTLQKMNMDSLSAISSTAFALAGAETTANFATEMNNPKRDFPGYLHCRRCRCRHIRIGLYCHYDDPAYG